MGRIVVGVDGSEHSVAALRWAVDYARATNHDVEALTTWSYPIPVGDGFSGMAYPTIDAKTLEEEARASLERALVSACPDAGQRERVSRIVAEDRPAHALIDASRAPPCWWSGPGATAGSPACSSDR